MTCRACLASCEPEPEFAEESMKNLDQSFYNDLSYKEIYEYCMGVRLKFEPNDIFEIPTSVCETCESNLILFYEFRLQCLKSENTIKEQIQNSLAIVEQKDDIIIEEITADYEQSVKEEYEEEIEEMPISDDIPYIELEVETESDAEQTHILEIEEPPASEEESPGEEVKQPPRRKYLGSNANGMQLGKSDVIVCPICGKAMKRFSMACHLRTHKDVPYEDRPFKCNLCDKRFMNRTVLKAHKNTHERIKKYQCPHCDEKFHVWATRKFHIVKCHTGEYRHECSFCLQRFWSKSLYLRHMMQHTGEKPARKVQCTLCDKFFISRHSLGMHMASHSDERNFKCTACDKTYKTNKHLRGHIKLQHKELL